MEEARCEATFPGYASPVLMLCANCSLFGSVPLLVMAELFGTKCERSRWGVGQYHSEALGGEM